MMLNWEPQILHFGLKLFLFDYHKGVSFMPPPQIIESEKFLGRDLESALSQSTEIVKLRKGNNPFCCTRLIIKAGLKRQ